MPPHLSITIILLSNGVKFCPYLLDATAKFFIYYLTHIRIWLSAFLQIENGKNTSYTTFSNFLAFQFRILKTHFFDRHWELIISFAKFNLQPGKKKMVSQKDAFLLTL